MLGSVLTIVIVVAILLIGLFARPIGGYNDRQTGELLPDDRRRATLLWFIWGARLIAAATLILVIVRLLS